MSVRLTFPGVLLALTRCSPRRALRSDDLPTFGCPTSPIVKGSAGPSCSTSLLCPSSDDFVSFATTRWAPFGTRSDQSRSRRTGDFQFAAFSGSSRMRVGGVDNLLWAVCKASTSSKRDSWGISGRCRLRSESLVPDLPEQRQLTSLQHLDVVALYSNDLYIFIAPPGFEPCSPSAQSFWVD
jgi:hypothetical protein